VTTRVLVVHHRTEPGGAAEALARLLRAVDRRRVDVHVLAPGGPAADLLAQTGARITTAPAAGFTHIWASTYAGARWALVGREAARLPRHALALRRLLRDGGFDVVHLNDSPLVPAARLAQHFGVPVVWHLRSALPPRPSRRSTWLRRTIQELAERSVAINDDVAASFDVGSEVVFDPVELDRFRPDGHQARAHLGVGPEELLVGFFGYLYPAKGYRELVAAARHVEDAGVRATWLLAGGGVRTQHFYRRPWGALVHRAGLAPDFESDATQLVRDEGLDGRVRLLPYTDEVERLMAACDVVVAPSRGPEIGLPALEAAASGVPVIATGTITGAGVVVPGETGVLVPGGGARELADAVAALARDPGLRRRIGAAARAHAERSFDARLSARRIEAIWAEVAERRRAAGPST
jgi:glycosyltransferase involved in cell wall biosynthesis